MPNAKHGRPGLAVVALATLVAATLSFAPAHAGTDSTGWLRGVTANGVYQLMGCGIYSSITITNSGDKSWAGETSPCAGEVRSDIQFQYVDGTYGTDIGFYGSSSSEASTPNASQYGKFHRATRRW